MICKILGQFVHPFTADDKYSLLKRDNLLQHFQIQLSEKRKTFSEFFYTVSKFKFNLEHFQKKDDPHSLWIFEFSDCQKCC